MALRDVRQLFSTDSNPFYAGFGNRETDVVSYRAVGVPATKVRSPWRCTDLGAPWRPRALLGQTPYPSFSRVSFSGSLLP